MLCFRTVSISVQKKEFLFITHLFITVKYGNGDDASSFENFVIFSFAWKIEQ